MNEATRKAKGCQSDCARRDAGRNGSALRARMCAQMTEKGLPEATQAVYVRAILRLVQHCGGRSSEAIETI